MLAKVHFEQMHEGLHMLASSAIGGLLRLASRQLPTRDGNQQDTDQRLQHQLPRRLQTAVLLADRFEQGIQITALLANLIAHGTLQALLAQRRG